jgi:F0F1-type ATP synthase assembly protein I
MSNAADKSDKTSTPPSHDKSTVILLFTIAADTTWRMFVPIIGGTIGGVWADNTFATKPLWTVIGVSVGIVVATLLVRQQLRKK